MQAFWAATTKTKKTKKGFSNERPFYRVKNVSKKVSKSNLGIVCSFAIANDKANVFSNKSSFYKTSLVIIDENRKRRFQAIRKLPLLCSHSSGRFEVSSF